MSAYAIGDIQGCYQSLVSLLKKIRFDPQQDQLWLVGDLVNRGPDSLATLRYLYSIRHSIKVVLGNHDLHFIARHYGLRSKGKMDTLDELLAASDCQMLVDWLVQQPLVYHDKNLQWTMVHAGIPPQWTLEQTLAYSAEVQAVLGSNQRDLFLSSMYGNDPDLWTNSLQGMDRLRLITNYCTRMRFCTPEGQLELLTKESAEAAPPGYSPWFTHPRKTAGHRIAFGHWAALQGKADQADIHALDTGCVWGGELTALNLQTGARTGCSCL
jgi:bis(5'-nucleosyl)-tetraphosphatase (symmetrical)